MGIATGARPPHLTPTLSAPLGRRGRRVATILFTLSLAGCNAAPSQTILGSYFPSWMICALVGLGAAIVLRQILVVAGIDRTLPAPLLVYLALAVAAAFATWLIWLDQPLRS